MCKSTKETSFTLDKKTLLIALAVVVKIISIHKMRHEKTGKNKLRKAKLLTNRSKLNNL